ncbi:MAG: pyruvate ferredoxin oxidoreductase subunit gamma [Nanoarchaeota archaeon]|nr:pyruvate ferredoxin oxidoreductase subunit gamma [Nanoarchaeota archaeon]
MIEIRIHGRGGQGAVTTGQIMAIAAFYDGKQSQTFPMFGVERSGAPVQAFARISDEKINIRSQIYSPDIVIVLDASLLETVDVTSGLKEKGTLIVNTNKKPADLNIKGNFNVHTVDATSIALKIFRSPIVNTPMLGAFSKITKEISLKSLVRAIDETFLETKGKKIAELNKEAITSVYNQTK